MARFIRDPTGQTPRNNEVHTTEWLRFRLRRQWSQHLARRGARVALYVVVDDAFKLVTTLAAGENGTTVRFVTTLFAGQRMVVSVPQAANQKPLELEFARVGDTVTVSEPSTVGGSSLISMGP